MLQAQSKSKNNREISFCENVDENYIASELSGILNESQNSFYDIDEGISRCKNLLKIETLNLNVGLTFIETFNSCLENMLVISTTSPLSRKADNIVLFVAKFLADFIETSDNESLNSITWKNISNFLINTHRANCDSVRYRICQILTRIFKYLNKDSLVPIDFLNKIKKCLIERTTDIKEEVQIEAINCMKYLQEPKNDFCEAIGLFIFILEHNGLSLKSRLQILDVIAINHQTLKTIKNLIFYPEVDIRLKTYDILIEKVSVKSFDQKYKFSLLKSIFKEGKSNSNIYIDKLLSRWLPKLNNNYLEFFSLFNFKQYSHFLDTEKLEDFILAAFTIKTEQFNSLKEKFLKDCNLTINFNLCDLTSTQAFYFRSIVLFLHKYSPINNKESLSLDYHKIFQQIELFLCEKMISQVDSSENREENLFILQNLLDTLFFYAESFDENFICYYERVWSDIICDGNRFDEKLFDILFKYWKILEPIKGERIRKFSKLIAKIEDLFGMNINNKSSIETEKNKDNAVKTCLLISCELLNDSTVVKMNSIEAILEDLILSNISNAEYTIRIFAVRALGLCCLISVDIALKYLILFVQIVQLDKPSVVVEAQKALFNILVCYKMGNLNGHFNDDLNDEDFKYIIGKHELDLSPVNRDLKNQETDKFEIDKLIKVTLKVLISQLDSLNYEVKFLACEGFAKLFLSKTINNEPELLSKFLLILFDPILDNQKGSKIKSCLNSFFSLYAKKYSLLIFEQLFIPLVYTIMNAPIDLSFSRINLKDLSNYLSLLINQNENEHRIHDKIVFNLIDRMEIELKLKSFKKADELLFILLNFYDDSISYRRNSDKIKQINEKIDLIMQSGNLKNITKVDEFKEFSLFIKSILINKSSSKRKLDNKIDSDDEDENDGESIKRVKLEIKS